MATTQPFVHPEKNEDEFFLGNFTSPGGDEDTRLELETNTYKDIGWKTKRMGNRSYDVYGKLILMSNLRPVFVKKSEVKAEDEKTYDGLLKKEKGETD